MLCDAQRDEIILGQNQTRAALFRRAANAPPIVLAVATVQEIVNNEQRLFALASNVLEATLK